MFEGDGNEFHFGHVEFEEPQGHKEEMDVRRRMKIPGARKKELS